MHRVFCTPDKLYDSKETPEYSKNNWNGDFCFRNGFTEEDKVRVRGKKRYEVVSAKILPQDKEKLRLLSEGPPQI